MLFKHTLGYGKFFSADNDSGSSGADPAGGDGESTDDGTNAGTDGEGDPPKGDDDGKGDDVDALKTSIATLEDTLKKERTSRRTAEREVKRLTTELETAQSNTAGDEWQGKYEEVLAKYTDAVAERAVMDAARAANAVSPKAVYRSLRDRVEVDEAGAVKNLDTLIDELKADDPDLFRAAGGSLDGGATGGKPRTDAANPTDRMRNYYASKH